MYTQQLAAVFPLDLEVVAGKLLAGRDPAQVEREVGRPGKAAGFLMKVRNLENPAVALVPGVLSGDTVKPSLDAASQPEIGRVFARMMDGLAAEAAVPKTVVIDATYLKAHRTATSLRSKKAGPATSAAV